LNYMARPERSLGLRPSPLRARLVELPTAWFVVFRLNLHILLYFYPFMRLALSNKTGLFGLIWLYSGLFAAIYWTTETIDTPSNESG
jgi:hypothetical protein